LQVLEILRRPDAGAETKQKQHEAVSKHKTFS
jgi:hypothetical protein